MFFLGRYPGQDRANPFAFIRALALMLGHSLDLADLAVRVEDAVSSVLASGLRTVDLGPAPGTRCIGTEHIGNAIVAALLAGG